jgi:translation initiation factor 2 alpha subunit (eIF-2alpha)
MEDRSEKALKYKHTKHAQKIFEEVVKIFYRYIKNMYRKFKVFLEDPSANYDSQVENEAREYLKDMDGAREDLNSIVTIFWGEFEFDRFHFYRTTKK